MQLVSTHSSMSALLNRRILVFVSLGPQIFWTKSQQTTKLNMRNPHFPSNMSLTPQVREHLYFSYLHVYMELITYQWLNEVIHTFITSGLEYFNCMLDWTADLFCWSQCLLGTFQTSVSVSVSWFVTSCWGIFPTSNRTRHTCSLKVIV